jgi:hypothetical protein
MKTFIRTAIAFTIFLFFAFNANSISKKDPRITNGNNPAGITYVVEVDMANTGGICHAYSILITDENGALAASPKSFQEGISTYVFHEKGPVSGQRIARMVKGPNSSPNTCNQVLFAVPDAVTSIFRNGSTYLFYLSPILMPANNQ